MHLDRGEQGAPSVAESGLGHEDDPRTCLSGDVTRAVGRGVVDDQEPGTARRASASTARSVFASLRHSTAMVSASVLNVIFRGGVRGAL